MLTAYVTSGVFLHRRPRRHAALQQPQGQAFPAIAQSGPDNEAPGQITLRLPGVVAGVPGGPEGGAIDRACA